MCIVKHNMGCYEMDLFGPESGTLRAALITVMKLILISVKSGKLLTSKETISFSGKLSSIELEGADHSAAVTLQAMRFGNRRTKL
jgi:hypothetical protein